MKIKLVAKKVNDSSKVTEEQMTKAKKILLKIQRHPQGYGIVGDLESAGIALYEHVGLNNAQVKEVFNRLIRNNFLREYKVTNSRKDKQRILDPMRYKSANELNEHNRKVGTKLYKIRDSFKEPKVKLYKIKNHDSGKSYKVRAVSYKDARNIYNRYIMKDSSADFRTFIVNTINKLSNDRSRKADYAKVIRGIEENPFDGYDVWPTDGLTNAEADKLLKAVASSKYDGGRVGGFIRVLPQGSMTGDSFTSDAKATVKEVITKAKAKGLTFTRKALKDLDWNVVDYINEGNKSVDEWLRDVISGNTEDVSYMFERTGSYNRYFKDGLFSDADIAQNDIKSSYLPEEANADNVKYIGFNELRKISFYEYDNRYFAYHDLEGRTEEVSAEKVQKILRKNLLSEIKEEKLMTNASKRDERVIDSDEDARKIKSVLEKLISKFGGQGKGSYTGKSTEGNKVFLHGNFKINRKNYKPGIQKEIQSYLGRNYSVRAINNQIYITLTETGNVNDADKAGKQLKILNKTEKDGKTIILAEWGREYVVGYNWNGKDWLQGHYYRDLNSAKAKFKTYIVNDSFTKDSLAYDLDDALDNADTKDRLVKALLNINEFEKEGNSVIINTASPSNTRTVIRHLESNGIYPDDYEISESYAYIELDNSGARKLLAYLKRLGGR